MSPPCNFVMASSRPRLISQKVEHYRRELLSDGGSLKSGELVEVELEIDSKNDYEYVLFEDYKAAGFEPIEVRSGYNGNDLGGTTSSTATTASRSSSRMLGAGESTAFRTGLHTRCPGKFHALPRPGAGNVRSGVEGKFGRDPAQG